MTGSSTSAAALSFYNGQFGGKLAVINDNTIVKPETQQKFSTRTLLQKHQIHTPVLSDGRVIIHKRTHAKRGFEIVPPIVRSMRQGLEVWLERNPEIIGIVDDVYSRPDGTVELHWRSGDLPHLVQKSDVLVWRTINEAYLNGRKL